MWCVPEAYRGAQASRSRAGRRQQKFPTELEHLDGEEAGHKQENTHSGIRERILQPIPASHSPVTAACASHPFMTRSCLGL